MKKRLLALPVALLILAVTAFGVVAETATINITGNPLSVTTAPIPLEAVSLNGIATTSASTGTITWTAVDPRGTGEGWHLTIESTNFSDGTNTIEINDVANDQEFKIQLLDDNVEITDGNTKPVSDVEIMTAIPEESGAPVRFLSAAVGSGMGTYTLVPTFELEIPADVYAGNYQATVTVTIVTGPGT